MVRTIVSTTTGALACVLLGCSDASSGAAAAAEDPTIATQQRAVLADLGEDVILDALVRFEAVSAALAAAAAGSDVEAARSAWRDAMAVWQECEVYQLGPAGVMGEVVGGKDYRDLIYSWPLVNACRVDQETAKHDPTAALDPTARATLPVNVRGLAALERLLFIEGADNACSPQSAINADGTWAALGDDGVKTRRLSHAAALAALLAADARTLADAWRPGGGDFVGELATAGDGSTVYGTARDALNAVTDAALYLDKATKDMKLAEPAGIMGCDAEICPDAEESALSRRSREHVLANVLAWQKLLVGGAGGRGLTEILKAAGADDLATDLVAATEAALADIEAIPGTLREALLAAPDSVRKAHESLRAVTVLLKTDVFTVLDLELPKRVASDTD
jgi:predicted lipoprotein